MPCSASLHPVTFPTNRTGGTLDEKMASVTRWNPMKQAAHREDSISLSRQKLAHEQLSRAERDQFAHIFSNHNIAAPVGQTLVPRSSGWHHMNPAMPHTGVPHSAFSINSAQQAPDPGTTRYFHPPQEERNRFSDPLGREMAIYATNRDITCALDVLSSLSMPERPSSFDQNSHSASRLPLPASLAPSAPPEEALDYEAQVSYSRGIIAQNLGKAKARKRQREGDETRKTGVRNAEARRQPRPTTWRHAYKSSKAHMAYGEPQEYICGYCGAQRTSASACTVS